MNQMPTMMDALRLTRAGKLGEAAGLIRAALAGGAQDPAPPAATPDAIDVTPDRITLTPRRAAGRSEPRPAPRPDLGRFESHVHRGAGATLRYRLYVPANATAGMPLVVMLHGCTQSAEDFARGTGMNRLADELGFLVAYPEQAKAANAQRCWNWFRPQDQQREQGEPALIAGLTRAIVAEHRIDPARVFVAGLSAGGAAAAIMGAAYPDLYAAVGIHSGLACGSASDLPGALAAMRGGGTASGARDGERFVPVITFHGDRDATVHETNARAIVAAAARARGVPLTTRVETGRSDGGRRYTRALGVDEAGGVMIEQWTIHGAGHAWSGGDAAGSYTDPSGPDASRAFLRFFLDPARRERPAAAC